MILSDLIDIITSPGESEQLLTDIGVLRNFSNCIYCGEDKIGRIRRNKIKCYKCKKEWSDKSGSVIEDFRINPKEFLLAVKFFSLGLSMKDCVSEIKLNKRTARKIYDLIRSRICTCNLLDEAEHRHLYLEFIRATGKDKIKVNYLLEKKKNIVCKQCLAIVTLRRTRNRHYDIFYKIESFELKSGLNTKSAGELSHIIRKLKHRLEDYNKLKAKQLQFIVEETVFRFNNRSNDLFDEVIKLLRIGKGGR